jgi:hypothetical protein
MRYDLTDFERRQNCCWIQFTCRTTLQTKKDGHENNHSREHSHSRMNADRHPTPLPESGT